MAQARLFDRLHALAPRKRWIVGVRASARGGRLHAALVGCEGRGLAARAEVFAHRRARAPREVRRLFARLHGRGRRRPADAMLLAAQLAECQAALLDSLAAEVAPVWDRLLAVAVFDPGLWCRRGGLTGCWGLCDAARLAEFSGQNVIDAFAARDLAQDGRGRPLLPIPHWILLHDLQTTRVLITRGRRRARVTWLPGSRDAAGAAQIRSLLVEIPGQSVAGQDAAVEPIVGCLTTSIRGVPPVDEIVISADGNQTQAMLPELAARMPGVRVLQSSDLGIPLGSLGAAGTAVLGLLHLDQTPAAGTGLTGARTPRVLGRLTPGSLPNWHRLVRELAAAKPSVVSLRSAI